MHVAKILLIEDDAELSMLVTRRLNKRGFEVVTAADRTTGVQRARDAAPDLILMDVELLPEKHGGLEATREIKADPATKQIPVIILSASAMPADRDQAFAAGCDDIEEKPMDLPRLLDKIQAHLRKREGS